MSEVGGNNGGPFPNETAFVGEAVAGEAAATLKLVKSLVKGISVNTFDLAEALHKVKSHKFYAPKHNTFGEYAKSSTSLSGLLNCDSSLVSTCLTQRVCRTVITVSPRRC